MMIASSPTAALKPGSKTRRKQLPHASLIDDDVERITGDSCIRSTIVADEPAQQEKPQRGSSPHCGYPGKN